MKYTKGPWYVEPEDVDAESGEFHEPTVYTQTDAGARAIATVRIGLEDSHANARLIAAAPEMYEALKAFAEPHAMGDAYVKFAPRLIEAARKAIVKAEGSGAREELRADHV